MNVRKLRLIREWVKHSTLRIYAGVIIGGAFLYMSPGFFKTGWESLPSETWSFPEGLLINGIFAIVLTVAVLAYAYCFYLIAYGVGWIISLPMDLMAAIILRYGAFKAQSAKP